MLSNTQILLGDDNEAKLAVINEITEARLKVKLGGVDEIPDALEYIVTEVSLIRFNRIGSEGLKSHSVEGEKLSWDKDDDFEPYMSDIEAYLDEQADTRRGRVRFI